MSRFRHLYGAARKGLIILGICISAILIHYVTFFFPHIHNRYIRNTAGSEVVYIKTEKGGGTGFHVLAPSGKSYILTNKHVCEGVQQNGSVPVSTDEVIIPTMRKVIKVSEEHDLCIVESLPGHSSGIELSEDLLKIGAFVSIVGHPKLQPLTITNGEFIGATSITLIEAVNIEESKCKYKYVDTSNMFIYVLNGITSLCLRDFPSFIVTATAYPGNSGSPVVDYWGNLVGVLFAGPNDNILQSMIVPLDYVADFLKDF